MPISRTLTLFSILCLWHAAPVGAQGLQLSLAPGVTRMESEWSGTAGGEVLVALRPGLSVGGGATVLLRTVVGGELSTGEAGELDMAYGGAIVEVNVGNPWLRARLLLGGGHVILTDPVVGTRADADSFVVVEPGVRATLRVTSGLGVSAGLGYRWVDGTGGLPGLPPGRLTSPTASLGLTLSR